jgi:hypothetical protein
MAHFGRFFQLLTVALLIGLLPIPQDVIAQDHVVSRADLKKDVAAAAQTRQANLINVQKFLSSDQAREALESANLPYEKIQKAVSALSDEELARIAARTDLAQKDFAAGRISDRDLIIILLCLAGLVLIIVAVH